MSSTRPVLLGALVAAGCGEKDSDDTGAAAETTAPWTEHYFVESSIAASGFTFEESYWARRIVDPESSTIDEEFVATADGTLTETALMIDAEAGTFTLVINDGQYTGEGTLHGEPWAWTSWESRSVASDGSYVLSEDEVTSTGLAASKVGYSADDVEEWTLEEVLTAASEAEWQAGVEAAAAAGR